MKTFSVWITGISGAGKTTLAKIINAILNSNQHASVILDGDEIRKKMSKDLGYSIKDRDENIRRIACISELLSHQKYHYHCFSDITHEKSTCTRKGNLW